MPYGEPLLIIGGVSRRDKKDALEELGVAVDSQLAWWDGFSRSGALQSSDARPPMLEIADRPLVLVRQGAQRMLLPGLRVLGCPSASIILFHLEEHFLWHATGEERGMVVHR